MSIHYLPNAAQPKPLNYGHVAIGDTLYPNSWVPAGTVIRQPVCWVCLDTGRETTDDDSPGPVCECRAGDLQRDECAHEGPCRFSHDVWGREVCSA